jgi:hypothetical protein
MLKRYGRIKETSLNLSQWGPVDTISCLQHCIRQTRTNSHIVMVQRKTWIQLTQPTPSTTVSKKIMLLQHVWYVGFWTKSILTNTVFLFLLSLLDLRFTTLTHFPEVSYIWSAHTRDNKQKQKITTSAPSVVQINQVKHCIQPSRMVCHMLKSSTD